MGKKTPEQKAAAAAYAREYRARKAKEPGPPEGTLQRCRVCGVEKPLSDFYSNLTCELRVDTRCKACVLELKKTPEERVASAARMREFRKKREDDPVYKDRVKKTKKRAYWKDPEKSRRLQRVRWATDDEFREAQKAKNKVRYHSDPELRQRMSDAQKAKRATPEGRDSHNQHNRQYKTSPKGRSMGRAHAAMRRARLLGVRHDLTPEQWEHLKQAYEWLCAYCAKPVLRPEMDHVVALARGGEHTADNVVPACGGCNRKKNDKTLEHALSVLKIDPEDYELRRSRAQSRFANLERRENDGRHEQGSNSRGGF